MQLYNDRRVYPGGGGPAVANGDGFVPAPTATAATGGAVNDRRNGRGRYVDGRNGVFHVLCISDSIVRVWIFGKNEDVVDLKGYIGYGSEGMN
jgi:hypothetical protein